MWMTVREITTVAVGDYEAVTRVIPLNLDRIAYMAPFNAGGPPYYEIKFGANDSVIVYPHDYERILREVGLTK
jgi:hypothetical protein